MKQRVICGLLVIFGGHAVASDEHSNHHTISTPPPPSHHMMKKGEDNNHHAGGSITVASSHSHMNDGSASSAVGEASGQIHHDVSNPPVPKTSNLKAKQNPISHSENSFHDNAAHAKQSHMQNESTPPLPPQHQMSMPSMHGQHTQDSQKDEDLSSHFSKSSDHNKFTSSPLSHKNKNLDVDSAPHSFENDSNPAVQEGPKLKTSHHKNNVANEHKSPMHANMGETKDENKEHDVATPVNVQQVTLDTMSIDAGGNWLAKRYWYQKAEELYDNMRMPLQQVANMQVSFYQAAQHIGQKLDDFYDKVSFEKGHLDQLIEIVKKELDSERASRGDLSVHDRAEMQSLKAEQQKIKNLGAQIDYIHRLDKKIDQTVSDAMNHIAKTLEYEQKAWQSFKAIGKELNDQKAQQEYYKMQSYQKNIEQMHSYLSGALMSYLQQKLIGQVTKTMDKAHDVISDLQQNGIKITDVVNLHVKKDPILVAQREAEQKKAAQELAKKQKEHQKKEKRSVTTYKHKQQEQEPWYQRVWCAVYTFIKDIYCTIYKYLRAFWCTMKVMLN